MSIMPKDLKGRELPKGIYQRKDGRYEARALINGIKIQLYNFNLKELKVEFEKRKEEVWIKSCQILRWMNGLKNGLPDTKFLKLRKQALLQ